MTMTTIKVSRETRDRLKQQASAVERTLGEHLEALADAADRDARFRHLRDAIATTGDAGLQSWRDETDSWLQAELDARER